jgi:hypothetical protein
MIKSQDDLNPCNDGKRSSDVLVATIEKCERLQKQLDIAIKGLKEYAIYKCKDSWFAETTLEQIKELKK